MQVSANSIGAERLRVEAIRRGRAPAEGSEPGANVLKDGFRTPIPCVPEDARAIKQRDRQWFYALCPRNDWHAWLVEDVSLCSLKLDRLARIERRERDRAALRASLFWDDDRRIEAGQLGAKLGDDPAATLPLLRKSLHGCEWLMTRWALLARAADRDGGWDEAQTRLAFDLMGTPAEFRRGTPGESIDLDGRAEPAPGGLAAFARLQVAALRERSEALADADALDRALARSDMADGTTPEIRRLRRYEATLHKRLRWSLHQLQQEPKYARPHPDLKYLFDAEPEPAPEPTPEPTPEPVATIPPPEPLPKPEEGPEPVDLPEIVPARTRRRDPADLKAEARRRDRERRRDDRGPS